MRILILVATLAILFSGCIPDGVIASHFMTTKQIVLLDKTSYPCARGGGDCTFKFYVYDGTSAYWCDTDKETYMSRNVGDTVMSLFVIKTRY